MSKTARLKTVPITSSNANKKPRGRPFEPGNTVSRGRPKGSLNRSTVVVRELLSENVQAVTEKAIALAKQGDPMALRLIMDRIAPVRAGAPLFWEMPPIRRAEDVMVAYQSMMKAVSVGDMTPHEGLQIKTLLEAMYKLFQSGCDPLFGFGPIGGGDNVKSLIKKYEEMCAADEDAKHSPDPEDSRC
jgi:hypothetical protein